MAVGDRTESEWAEGDRTEDGDRIESEWAEGGSSSYKMVTGKSRALPSGRVRKNVKAESDPAGQLPGGRPKTAKKRAGAVLRFVLKTVKRLFILAIVLAVAAAIYYYYRIYLPEVNAEKDYLFTEAVFRDLYSSVSATGKVAVTDETSLYIKTSQKVDKINVREGDRVFAGQILITYDIASEMRTLEQKREIAKINQLNAELGAQSIALPAAGNELLSYTADVNGARKSIRDSENMIESVKIRIKQQQIRVDDADSLAKKNLELYEQGFLTKDEYDVSVSAHKSARESLNDLAISLEGEEQNLEYRRTQLTEAEQKLNNVKKSLGDEGSRLRYEQQLNIAELSRIEIEQIDDDIANLSERTVSPVSGNVVSIGVVEGATASRSNPVITISDLSTIIVKADISQYDAPRLSAGLKAQVYIAGLPDKPYGGVISKIASASVEKESGSEKEVIVPVEIVLDAADDKIKTGYSADVDIIDREQAETLSVPAQAIFSDGGEQFVYILAVPAPGGDAPTGENNDFFGEARAVFADNLSTVKKPGDAVDYLKNILGWILEKIDGLFPKEENVRPIPVKQPVVTGFAGDNGTEIVSGLAAGDMAVLNP